MTTSVAFDWMEKDGEKLEKCRHDHPFAVLGPQPHQEEWIVRVWMPEAENVDLLIDGKTFETTSVNHPWIFETQLDQDPGSNYRIRVLHGGTLRIGPKDRPAQPLRDFY